MPTDAEVDGYFAIAERVDRRCPECGTPLSYDHDADRLICPKCGYIDAEARQEEADFRWRERTERD